MLGAALDLVTQERQRRADKAGDGSGAAPSQTGPSQTDLAERAMKLKTQGAEASAMLEDGSPLHPQDPDADAGKGAMADKARNIAPSGALDHGGELPSRERSRTRY